MTVPPTERCWCVLKNGVKCFFVILAICISTVAQDKRGTVIALVTSSNGTIIAADSRNHPTQGKISDDLCKILTFGNKVAVALGGLAAHTSPLHPARNWDGFKQ